MTYAKPNQEITFSWTNEDIGTASVADSLIGPQGKVGLVKECVINHVTTAVTVTTGIIEVGATAGSAEYLSWAVPAISTGDAARASDVSGSIKDVVMPADTQIEVTFNDPGATGVCDIHLVTEWF